MSEIQSRPPASRGRSSTRGGRGGPRVGGRGGKHVNGDHKNVDDDDTAVELGELGDLKKQYNSELGTLKELFVDWTDVDLLLALQETGGDLTTTIDRISEGNVSKFAEVPKGKDRARSKVKDAPIAAADTSSTSIRVARGRGGSEAPRGVRGGRPDRGRGGFRGGSRGVAQIVPNGTRAPEASTSVPTNESSAWDAIPSNKEGTTTHTTSGEGIDQPSSAATGVSQTGVAVDVSTKPKTWASMFAPKPKPILPKPENRAPLVTEPDASSISRFTELNPSGTRSIPEFAPEVPHDEDSVALAPSKDELTEVNVEHLPDETISKPITETAASQVGSTRDIGSAAGSLTPSIATQQPIGRPALGGYATTALKATTGANRTPSFQRRIMEQREAVVMPSNDAVHRSAVQFGMMDLNGEALDVDEEREDAETRPQAPPQSPPSQPRASLPPAPRQAQTDTAADSLPTPRQAPGLPPAPAQQQHSPSSGLGGLPQPSTQASQAYNQFSRFGNQSGQPESSLQHQKPYDAFGQHGGPLDAYGSQSQAHLNHHQVGGQSTASADYSSYYTADQRNAYQNYYNSNPYGQHNTALQQEAGSGQQKNASGFGVTAGESGFSSQAQQASNASRFNEAQGSGQNTPAPGLGAGNQSQAQHLQQGQYQNYNQQHHPYYQSPYYQSYMNYQQSYGGSYGGPYGGGKGAGMYGQGYGITPQQSSYEHSSSPANVGSFGQSGSHRESGLGAAAGSLGDFNRSGSTQPGQTMQQASSGGFGGMGDVYSRGQSGYAGSGSNHYGTQQPGQQAAGEESLKTYGDSKTSGPSPSAVGQPGRPGSATNTSSGQTQSGQQNHQQGFGGYPNNYGPGNQYGGLGGLGNQSGAQSQGGFGGYGGYSNQYGSSYGRGGGWGNNFQSH